MHLLDLKKVGATDAILESAEVQQCQFFFFIASLYVDSDHALYIPADKFTAGV